MLIRHSIDTPRENVRCVSTRVGRKTIIARSGIEHEAVRDHSRVPSRATRVGNAFDRVDHSRRAVIRRWPARLEGMPPKNSDSQSQVVASRPHDVLIGASTHGTIDIVPPRAIDHGTDSPGERRPDWLFYDGHCGLCHGAVRFVLARDRRPYPFRFAPLHGETFLHIVPEATRRALPDSLVVVTRDGAILTRSAGMLYVAQQLGGVWRALAALGLVVPRPIRDMVYDAIARTRQHLFAAPPDVCPVVPPHLRSRFDP